MRWVLTPVVGRLTTSLKQWPSSMQVHSNDRRLKSTWMVTPSTAATRFMVSRTRQAPVPLASISMPVRQMMDDLSVSGASTASSSPAVTIWCQSVFIWSAPARTPWCMGALESSESRREGCEGSADSPSSSSGSSSTRSKESSGAGSRRSISSSSSSSK